MKRLRSKDEIVQILQKDPIIGKVILAATLTGAQVYMVGGPVRDLFIGREVLDYDFVLIGDIHKFMKALASEFGDADVIYSQFLTAKLRKDKLTIDVAHARKERYPRPGALPDVWPAYDIADDLSRRDFTINAMAINLLNFDVVDLFGGLSDLQNGIIRVLYVGSFRDDPTRAFRAIRYRHRFGFRYDQTTEEELKSAFAWVRDVSFGRIRNELKRMAQEDKRAEMFIEVSDYKILLWMKADPEHIVRIDNKLEGRSPRHWVAFFAAFVFRSDFDWERLPLTRWEYNVMRQIKTGLGLKASTLSEIHKVFRRFDEISVKVISAIRGGIFEDYEHRRVNAKTHLKGEDLIKMGVPQGPLIGKIIELLEIQRLTGNIRTVEDEIEFVRNMLKTAD